MKKFLNFKHALFFLSFVLLLVSCREEAPNLPADISPIQEIASPAEQDLATETIDQLFSYLSQVDNLQELSMHDQYMMLQDYANEQGINFNLNKATFHYEEGLTQLDDEITREEEFLISEFSAIKDLIELHGFTSELVSAIHAYKSELLASLSKDHDISTDYVNSVLAIADQTSLMVTNLGFRRYIDKTAPALLNSDLEDRFNWGCLWANLALAGAIAGCASGVIASCAAIPGAQLSVFLACGGNSEPVDPCLNSPNPCCGVHCASGFYCNSNGVCVIDTNDPGCINNGCPPGFQCAGNTCIPI